MTWKAAWGKADRKVRDPTRTWTEGKSVSNGRKIASGVERSFVEKYLNVRRRRKAVLRFKV